MTVWLTALSFPQTAPTDDAENITSELHSACTLETTPAQQKGEDLTESTGVVPAKYTPKVKLELLSTLEY